MTPNQTQPALPPSFASLTPQSLYSKIHQIVKWSCYRAENPLPHTVYRHSYIPLQRTWSLVCNA